MTYSWCLWPVWQSKQEVGLTWKLAMGVHVAPQLGSPRRGCTPLVFRFDEQLREAVPSVNCYIGMVSHAEFNVLAIKRMPGYERALEKGGTLKMSR